MAISEGSAGVDRLGAFESTVRAHIKTRKSKNTQVAYTDDLNRWMAYCKANKVDPTDPAEDAAVSWKESLEAENTDPDKSVNLTIRRRLASLSSIYGAAYAKKNPTVTWNPFHPKALPWPESSEYIETKQITDEGALKIIAAAEADTSESGVRDAAVIWLLYQTGMRRGSVAGMLRQHFERDDGRIVVRVPMKGGRKTRIKVSAKATAALERWLSIAPESSFVFPGRMRGSMQPKTVNEIVARWKDEAKVAEEISPHSFRAAFITSALDAGVPLIDVCDAVQHADPKTTKRYDRGVRGEGVADKVAEFRERGGKP
jgi:integrase/recombinase XerD